MIDTICAIIEKKMMNGELYIKCESIENGSLKDLEN